MGEYVQHPHEPWWLLSDILSSGSSKTGGVHSNIVFYGHYVKAETAGMTSTDMARAGGKGVYISLTDIEFLASSMTQRVDWMHQQAM